MQYKVAVLAAVAVVANAQSDMSMAMPAAGGDMPMAMPAAGSDMPMPAAGGDMMSMAGAAPKFDNTTLTGQCKQIAFLTGFTKFANNDTQVQMAAQMIPLTPDQVNELKANASMASDQLKEIESNQTLADTCAQVNEVTGACKRLSGLTKLEELAQNDTQLAALQQKRNLTDAQVTSLKNFAAMESDNLDMMNNNITLVTQCMNLQHDMMTGEDEADAALTAQKSALSQDASNEGSSSSNSSASEKANKKSAASTITVSSFLAAAGIAASIVLFA